MNRIKILPESVKKKIAAGEVVEGPFSVIKELVENSIDADSTEIDVEVFDSGLKKIAIKDNGNGIFRDDLPLTIQNHATSKIADITDVESITSYGFRGEALSSISSISKLTVLTRSFQEKIGAKLVSNDEKARITEYAGAKGTTILVENLFYNIPARKKFLSSKSAELRKTREIFLKTALSNPGISFSFSVEEKRQITLPRVKKIKDRIEQIYGKSVLENLYYDRLKDIKVEIAGFLSKPDYLKSSRVMQMLFVNNRIIEYKNLGFLLSKAYEAIAPKGSYPAAIIFLKIDPILIDVNIHPAKREIKFFDQSYMNSLILQLGKKILGKQKHTINTYSIGTIGGTGLKHINDSSNVDNFDKTSRNNEQLLFNNRNNTQVEENFRRSLTIPTNAAYSACQNESFKSTLKDSKKLYNEINDNYEFNFLGIIFNTYILIEKDNELNIIDFHAAHERSIYDSLINKESQLEIQSLIFPQVIELPVEDYQIILENKKYFLCSAFDIDSFSDNTVVVRGIPDIVGNLNIEGFLSDIIESLKKETDHIKEIKITIAEKLACHSAKRSGDDLTLEDARLIASRALNGDYELRCPHGRPYIYKLEKKDLEKVFRRI